jgi:hypothetical protein
MSEQDWQDAIIAQGQAWLLDDGRTIYLLRPADLPRVPSGATLLAIDGEVVTVGTSEIDNDTRGGYLAFGVLPAEATDAEAVSG